MFSKFALTSLCLNNYVFIKIIIIKVKKILKEAVEKVNMCECDVTWHLTLKVSMVSSEFYDFVALLFDNQDVYACCLYE